MIPSGGGNVARTLYDDLGTNFYEGCGGVGVEAWGQKRWHRVYFTVPRSSRQLIYSLTAACGRW